MSRRLWILLDILVLVACLRAMGQDIPAGNIPRAAVTTNDTILGVQVGGLVRQLSVTDVVSMASSASQPVSANLTNWSLLPTNVFEQRYLARAGDNGSLLTNLTATAINPNVHVYTNTGIYCSITPTNNSYILSGAAGTHNNSLGAGVNFAQANGTYSWNALGKGNSYNGVQNTGIFVNNTASNWIGSFQYYAAAGGPRWIFYNTNVWSTSAADVNSVLAGGIGAIGVTVKGESYYLPDMTTSNFWTYRPDTTLSTVSLTPVYTTNTTVITASVINPAAYLLNFPAVGPSQSSERRWNVDPPLQPYPADAGIIHLTNGPGIVRGMNVMIGPFSPNQYRSNYWLQVFPDYGTNATAYSQVNSNFMTVNVPLTSLAMCKWEDPNGVGGLVGRAWHTKYVNVITDGINPFIGVTTELPCPYGTNGIFARVIDVAAGVDVSANLYSTVYYEPDLAGTLNFSFSNWRLHGVNSRFTSGMPNAVGVTDWSKTQVTMFTETNCAGVVLGVWCSVGDIHEGSMERATWEWICDGRYPPAIRSGEDLFNAPFEFSLGGGIMQPTFGTVNRLGAPFPAFPTYVDTYRQFAKDFPFTWQNDIKAIATTFGAVPTDPTLVIGGDITTFYYASH